jgi:hypothetical protein
MKEEEGWWRVLKGGVKRRRKEGEGAASPADRSLERLIGTGGVLIG